jgi:hypothetical protein
MPMDDLIDQEPRGQDWGLNRAKCWELKICWRPHTCFLTGKQLWGKNAYRGTRWIHGPGEPVEEYYWVEKNEFIVWNLKGRK